MEIRNLETDNNLIILSNGTSYIYNPYIFNKDSVLSWSIRRGEWLVTERVIIDLISLFNITEINFAGKNRIIVKDNMNYYIEIKFTETKITSVRVIRFLKCMSKGFELVPYKTSRGYLSLDEVPISFEEKVSMTLSDITFNFKTVVSRILNKFHNFKFE